MGVQVSNLYQRKPHFTFIWTIENASGLLVNEYAESPKFIAHSMEKTKWKILCQAIIFVGNLYLALQREDNGTDCIEIEFEFSFLAADGSPLRTLTAKKEFKSNDVGWIKIFENKKDVFSQRGAEFLPNDMLTIRCRMWRAGNEISKVDTCFARTRLRIDRRCFVWAIREFSSLQLGQKTKPFLSPVSSGSPQLILSLVLLKEKDGTHTVNINVDHNYTTKDHSMICTVSLLDCDGKVVQTKEIISFILINSSIFPGCWELFEKEKLFNEKSSLLPNDVLSLRCEIKIGAGRVWSRIENYRYLNLEDLEEIKREMPEIIFTEDGESFTDCCPFKKAFRDLYEDESLSDVILRADGKLFPAHKTILSARSLEFKAMFKRGMNENTSSTVDIPDINDDTLDRMLLYIYTDTVKEKWENAMHLFKAAYDFKLLDLQNICSSFLKADLSVNNVCSVLLLAYLHQDSELQKAAEDFISWKDNEVFTSKAWKIFKMENFQLALEITERIIHLISLRNSDYALRLKRDTII